MSKTLSEVYDIFILMESQRPLHAVFRNVAFFVTILVIVVIRHAIAHDFSAMYIGDYDGQDYRYIAEKIYGIQHDYTRYDPYFSLTGWGLYLDAVPFRGIGVGTIILVLERFFGNRIEIVLPYVIALITALAYTFYYVSCKKKYGGSVAAFSTAVLCIDAPWGDTIFPEMFLRPIFVSIIALCILLQGKKKRNDVLYICILLCVYLAALFKIQWWLLSIPLMFAMQCNSKTIIDKLFVILIGLCVPVSIILLHYYGWSYPHITAGSELHYNKRTQGAFFQSLCRTKPKLGPNNILCKQRDIVHINMQYRSFHPVDDIQRISTDLAKKIHSHFLANLKQTLQNLSNGFVYMTNYSFWNRYNILVQNCDRVESSIIATGTDCTILAKTYSPLYLRIIDVVSMLILIVGITMKTTRCLSSVTLSFWIVPAITNILSYYDIRYHFAQAGLPIVVSILIISQWNDRKKYLRRVTGLLLGVSKMSR